MIFLSYAGRTLIKFMGLFIFLKKKGLFTLHERLIERSFEIYLVWIFCALFLINLWNGHLVSQRDIWGHVKTDLGHSSWPPVPRGLCLVDISASKKRVWVETLRDAKLVFHIVFVWFSSFAKRLSASLLCVDSNLKPRCLIKLNLINLVILNPVTISAQPQWGPFVQTSTSPVEETHSFTSSQVQCSDTHTMWCCWL